MKLVCILIFFAISQSVTHLMAQTFEGVWRGTSLCQVKNSPCHDETVVYYVSKDSINKKFEVNASKIVNGKEDFMGTIIFTYDEKQNLFVSIDKERDSKWEFKITGNILKGTLLSKGILYRLVDLKRDN